jgi:hypothetical protein
LSGIFVTEGGKTILGKLEQFCNIGQLAKEADITKLVKLTQF